MANDVLNFFSQFWNDGRWYNFISGPLANITLLVGFAAWWKHKTCHVHRCWRFGRHGVEGTQLVVCRKHHPHGHLTADEVIVRADRAKRARGLREEAVRAAVDARNADDGAS
jgi:hypothetical protein